MNTHKKLPLTARSSRALSGRLHVPGDKSISHRALIIGAMAVGETRVSGLLEGEDVTATAGALEQLGAAIAREAAGDWRIDGVGTGGFTSPAHALDFGNSGTGVRLMMGALASQPVTARLTGDASLSRRPMRRVLEPLKGVGARVSDGDGEHLPLTFIGADDPLPIVYELPVPSAQVKSAVLLAGLNCPGRTSVIERAATRDHTERMLRAFGADVLSEAQAGGGTRITVSGHAELKGQALQVPADPSSAAFPLVAALLTPGSDIVLEGIMTNPTRTGLIATLTEMGADLEWSNQREAGGETVADLRVRAGPLRGCDVPAERAPAMIDEYPVLAVAAALAEGETRMRGLAELRVKESDRLAAVAAGLAACGVAHAVEGDDLIVRGGAVPGGATVETHMDHRIAMAFLVLGLAAREPVTVDDGTMIATSFPAFETLMTGIGCDIARGREAP